MANIELAQSQSPKLFSSLQSNSSNASLIYASGQALSFIVRIVWLALLLTVLVAALIVWIWLYSFRSGWQFWDWVHQSEDSTTLAPQLVYGLIILFVSPLILFADWSQSVIQQWLKVPFPLEVNLRQIVESQLGVKLGESFPFLREDGSQQK